MSDETEMSAVERRLRQSWAGRTTIRVYDNIEAERKRQGISAATLSNRCKELGHPIARAVIAKMDSKDRANISIPELMVIAEALGLAPLDLIYPPYSAGDEVERLPSDFVVEQAARERFIRYDGLKSNTQASDTAGIRFMVQKWADDVEEAERTIQLVTSPGQDTGYRSYLEKQLLMKLHYVLTLRRDLEGLGVSMPELPDGLAEVMEQKMPEILAVGSELDEGMEALKRRLATGDES